MFINFIETGHNHLLKHPLCESFLHLKWLKYTTLDSASSEITANTATKTDFQKIERTPYWESVNGDCFDPFEEQCQQCANYQPHSLCMDFPSLLNVNPYGGILSAVIKTLVMMAGEIEYENFIYEKWTKLYVFTGHLMVLIFVLLVSIILRNLLVGLAVSDIQGLQKSAGLDRLLHWYNIRPNDLERGQTAKRTLRKPYIGSSPQDIDHERDVPLADMLLEEEEFVNSVYREKSMHYYGDTTKSH
ncbi:unnamed protein product [Lepeophtheirus salmonis]|uniref:(salmon louse) hypothetical protein n=1 Tax=Lepeophtheirus salmonis TaxID=72036 RepID=A0A7R8H5E3_LEPSM|nr:unnamed protein product [Lepeophtheirus salmonis]CAF2862002.1 unnamed protein product [Lepeophtheirus salmonis]